MAIITIAVNFGTIFFGGVVCSGSKSLSSVDSSLDSLAELEGEISFLLDKVTSLLLSDSSLESMAVEEELSSDSLTWVAFFLLPTFRGVDGSSSSDDSE